MSEVRAFYRVPKAAILPGSAEGDYDVRVLRTGAEDYLVLAPEPRPAVAAAVGAEFLGSTWDELYAAISQEERDEVFLVRVRRNDRTVLVRTVDLLEGEEARSGPIPPTRYLGDPTLRPLAL